MKVYRSETIIEKVAAVESSDGKKQLYRFEINNDKVNRNGWLTKSAGIKTEKFMLNPVVLGFHNQWSHPVGLVEQIILEGDKLYADVWFHELTQESIDTKKLVDAGVYRATSIGIIPTKNGQPLKIEDSEKDKYPYQESIPVFEESELLELSIVPVPANSDTLLVEKLTASFGADGATTLIELLNNANAAYQQMQKHNSEILNKEAPMPEKETGAQNAELQSQVNGLTAKNAELTTQLATAKEEAAVARKEADESKAKLADMQKSLDEQARKLCEAEVEAAMAKLANKITPAEKDKLQKDLLHFASNRESMKDSDGVSLYDAKLAEIEARKLDTAVLTKPLDAKEAEAGKSELTLEDIDLNDPDDRAKMVAEISRRAEINKTSFNEEYAKFTEVK